MRGTVVWGDAEQATIWCSITAARPISRPPRRGVRIQNETRTRVLGHNHNSRMIRLFKNRFKPSLGLGPLEVTVMEVLWSHGESNVRDVVEKLRRPLAYTTVMTTCDRLYKKGLLHRRKEDRAFDYWSCFSRREVEQKRAGDFVADLLASPQHSGELLISCLVDAVGQQDGALLDELEKKIRLKKRELEMRRKV